MDNLILICGTPRRPPPRRVHHHPTRDQQFRFLRDGVLLLEHVDPSALFDTDIAFEAEHDHVAPDAAGNRWDGYRMNLSYAVSCLAVPRYRNRDGRRNQQAS